MKTVQNAWNSYLRYGEINNYSGKRIRIQSTIKLLTSVSFSVISMISTKHNPPPPKTTTTMSSGSSLVLAQRQSTPNCLKKKGGVKYLHFSFLFFSSLILQLQSNLAMLAPIVAENRDLWRLKF